MGLLCLSANLCLGEEREEEINGEEGALTPVYLNVYDLTPFNNYLYWFGLGIFHSGIEVHGVEYGFGAHDNASSGIFEVIPRSCPGFIFRQSVLLGTTRMSNSDFRSFKQSLSRKYPGDTYHLIAKNCNHFTEDVSFQVTGKHIPGWINRMARIGSFCNCILPESIQIPSVNLPEAALELSDYNDGSVSSSDEIDGELHQEPTDDVSPQISLKQS